jgi:putative endonuclease
MAKHNETGINGEKIAENFLINLGYTILHRNWRSGSKEIDLIALHADTLVFIEIKTRTSYHFGYPEEAVTRSKQKYLKAAAEAFTAAHPQYPYVRFDIISILIPHGRIEEIKHFIEAFY